jgi:hypothetical protein
MKLPAFPLLLAFMLAPVPAPAQTAAIGAQTLGNIFLQGETVAIPVRSNRAQDVRWTVQDFFGRETASGNAHLDNGAALITPSIQTPGYFTLQVEDARAPLAVVPRPAPSADSPFGVMTHFAKGWPTDIIPLIEKAGIAHVRDEQPWRMIERRPGQYEFPPRLSNYMTELNAHHLDPVAVLAFSNPLYDNDQTPFSAAGRAGYAAYAKAVVQHYGTNLGAVEIWNEYNGSFCAGPCKKDRPGTYTPMLQEAYKSVKSVKDSLTVLGGAAVPIPLDYYRQLFADGALNSMDAVVIHPYRRQPEGVEEQIESLRQIMARYGTPKPIWATEFSDLPDMKKSRDDVARYLVRMSTLLLAAHVDRLYWYLLRDYQEFTGLGLLHDESSSTRYAPAPAYVAYAVLIHELTGSHFVRRDNSNPDVRAYVFAEGGREIRVIWTTQKSAIHVMESQQPVRRISMMGDDTQLTPQAGRISVTLDNNPIYVESGS